MLDRVPVPTDNIYKFIALFSLVTLIFSVWQTISFTTASNAIVMKNFPEIEELKSLESRSRVQEAKLAVLEREMEVVIKDKKFVVEMLSWIVGLSVSGIVLGFGIWLRKIQPLIDAHSKAQLELLELQIERLKIENMKLKDSQTNDESKRKSSLNALVDIVRDFLEN